MSVIVSLQGGMAVGKTTVAKYIETTLPWIHVSYEDPLPILKIIKERQLNKDVMADYVEIQKLFIASEIKRWRSFEKYDYVLTDLGAKEIEFYTLFYPKTQGFDWPIDLLLQNELKALRALQVDHVLFLETESKQLIRNKEGDKSRQRGSFEFYLKHLLKEKTKWLLAFDNCSSFNCSGLKIEGQCQMIHEWLITHIV